MMVEGTAQAWGGEGVEGGGGELPEEYKNPAGALVLVGIGFGREENPLLE